MSRRSLIERGIIPLRPAEHELKRSRVIDRKSTAAPDERLACNAHERAAKPLSLSPWQTELRAAVRDPAELLRLLDLRAADVGVPALTPFTLLVPRGFIARMRKGDPRDPLFRQVWPDAAELAAAPGYTADPVREQGLATHGVIRKYFGRALLIATGACPLHCRYCFRRAFPYGEQLAARADWSRALAELRKLGDVREAILSGGDPLTLSNRRLADLFARLGDTAVTTVRIHTRFPIAIPERVDAGLLRILRATRLATVIVVHSNHPNELDERVAAGLDRLRPALAALLNQSVLLRGVNDDCEVLATLSERLFACGVLPYYLHLLDRVAGAAHFDVDEATGKRLLAALRSRLPGYLVPRLVRETPGELNKTSIA
jgi:EF-P beta-lysylation protein EpmB